MMSAVCSIPMHRFVVLGALALMAAGAANAQSIQSADADRSTAIAATESSSNDYLAAAGNDAPSDPAPSPAAHAAGQYDNNGGGRHGILSHWAFEAGGGFNAPAGDSGSYITWGGNLTVGAGLHFGHGLAALIEYQYIDDKLPGAIIAQTGATGGNAHIWSFTVDPVLDLMPKKATSAYITGGGGFYRKVTNFTDPVPTEYCDYYYCGIGYENAVVGHFSSNQGGWNVGGGITHRMGGVYGDGKMQIFAEARYLDILTPAVTTSPNGLGTTTVGANTRLIPVTFGVRF